MKIIAELKQPYTDEERANFIVEYNHNLGYLINFTEDGIEALWYTEEEKSQLERERLDSLYLTAADVERAIYKSKGIDFEDILELVKDNSDIDIKALKIELKANNFYRGNPYVEAIGNILGFSSEDLDYLFENGEFRTKDL